MPSQGLKYDGKFNEAENRLNFKFNSPKNRLKNIHTATTS